jgi:hypothetical protein
MPVKLYSVEAFHEMVRGFVKEAIHDHMINELERLNLKELGGVAGTSPTSTSSETTGTSGTSTTSGTKSGVGTTPGNNDPANSVMVPGTNMNLNAGLAAASKEKNFKKKAELIQKISGQLAGMKGLVVKEDTK